MQIVGNSSNCSETDQTGKLYFRNSSELFGNIWKKYELSSQKLVFLETSSYFLPTADHRRPNPQICNATYFAAIVPRKSKHPPAPPCMVCMHMRWLRGRSMVAAGAAAARRRGTAVHQASNCSQTTRKLFGPVPGQTVQTGSQQFGLLFRIWPNSREQFKLLRNCSNRSSLFMVSSSPSV